CASGGLDDVRGCAHHLRLRADLSLDERARLAADPSRCAGGAVEPGDRSLQLPLRIDRSLQLPLPIPPDAQGELQGAVAGLYSLSSIVGPPLMTQVFGHFSARSAGLYFPGAAFLT